jgi:hypothetical protein
MRYVLSEANSEYPLQQAIHSPCVRYAIGNLAGKYDEKTFEGLVNAYVAMQERKEAGKGMQGLEYTPEFLEMCHDLHATSPAAYRALSEVIQVPTERSIQQHRSKEPKFPYDIGERNFDLVREHLDQIAYDGPVGLACDDTKLLSNLGLVYDAEKKKHFLIGGSDGPVEVLDPESLRAVMENCKDNVGTKVCEDQS